MSTRKLNMLFSLLLFSSVLAAQDGNAGIYETNTRVCSYFVFGTNLLYDLFVALRLI